jgi:ABC-2 type transport system permease protein
MGLLLGNPITRSRVVVEKSVAMVLYATGLGITTFVSTWIGVLLAGLEVSGPNIAAASALVTLMSLVFGGLAMAVGAATGRSRLASWSAAGVGLFSYFMFSFFPLSDTFAGWSKFSPFDLYLGSDPLNNGMAWGDAAILAGLFVALVALSIPLWSRRDLRG